ncbi:MAG: hypothetical protein FJ388_02960 [Verrucomicrobia bacterium]|nr:hypothetical protein [Verrucomicrobiota bacterium]
MPRSVGKAAGSVNADPRLKRVTEVLLRDRVARCVGLHLVCAPAAPGMLAEFFEALASVDKAGVEEGARL